MAQATRTTARQLVYELFQAGLAAVHGKRCVASYLGCNLPGQPVSLVATGKAASAMTHGAMDTLGRQLIDGLVITKAGHVDEQLEQEPRLHCIEAGHPVPDNGSLLAGDALCQFLQAVPLNHELLFLISGGTSSLVEVLSGDNQLDNLVQLNRQLLGSGLSIDKINRARRSLSEIKGGGLLRYVKNQVTTVLLISDVPGDDLCTIGSGLLYPCDPSIPNISLPETVQHHIIARNAQALQAAADRGREQGYEVTVMEQPLTGNAERAGQEIASQLKVLPDGIYLWGGETTLKLPDNPGFGGRNQHLALSAARALSSSGNIVLLAAGTDGTDGPTRNSGAIIDSGTLGRGELNGLDAKTCLQLADSGSFLSASGDVLQTGPTGTNVMDMVVAYKGNYSAIEQTVSGNC